MLEGESLYVCSAFLETGLGVGFLIFVIFPR